jgi:uncharacterized repeat protein (TIGR02543 family)
MTAVKCANCDQIAIAAKDAHVAGADDGDCTTAVKCANCEKNAVEAKASHTPGADDGDCTTAVKCANCEKNAVEAKASHTPGADDGDCTTAVKCVNCEKNAVEAKASHTPAEDDGDCTTAVKCVNCEKNAVEAKASHTGGEATCKEKAECAVCGKKYGEFDDDNHASDKVTYTNNDKNHSATYDCCGAAYVTNEAHTYTNHVCVCGYVERFVITMDANGGKFINGAPVYPVQSAYGTPFYAVPADPTKEGYKFVGWNTKADGTGDDIDLIPGTYTFTADLTVYAQWEVEHVCAHHHYNKTATQHQSICSCGEILATEDCSFGATHETACVCGNTYTGWAVVIDGEDGVIEYSIYVVNGQRVRGWTQIGEDWYYLNTMSGYRAEGLYRAPYPKTAINGKTYAPNAEDLAYYNAHKDTSKYTDATYALFVFDKDGKFQQTTGIVNGKHFAVNGCVAWHVGFVEIDGAYYYFAGDTSEEMNGNVMVTGKVYATRDYNTGKAVDGAIYMFGEDGKLIKNAGIVDGYYYNEDNSLAIGAGLVECGDGYIYVRSNGQVVTDAKYWLTASKLADAGITDLKAGMYTFDENGMLVRPQVEPELDGIVEKDGKYYYYVDGVKQAGAGVIEMSDESGTFYIYVTSDGTLATGKYWPTNLNGLLKSGCYDWGTDGKYYPNAN